MTDQSSVSEYQIKTTAEKNAERDDRRAEKVLEKINPELLGDLEMGEKPGQLVGLNIGTVLQGWEFAKIMALGGSTVPKWMRGNPGGCMFIIARALELRMSPYAISGWAYEVEAKNGDKRVAWESGFYQAVVNRRAPIKHRLKHEIIGEGEDRRCRVWTTIIGEDDPRIFISEPLKALRNLRGSPLWVTKPETQITFNAIRDFSKLHFADVVAGILTVDELQDDIETIGPDNARDVSPQSTTSLRLTALATGEGFGSATSENRMSDAINAARTSAAKRYPGSLRDAIDASKNGKTAAETTAEAAKDGTATADQGTPSTGK
jgi:hypothetical protein